MRHHSFLKDYAKEYDKFYVNKEYDRESKELKKIFEKYQVGTVMDIACGTGEHLKRLKAMGYEVRGYDLSPDMVRIARKKGIPACVMPMQELKTSFKFDAAICMFASFDYLIKKEDVERMLSNVHNSLKINGVFVFDFWNKPYVIKNYKPISVAGQRVATTTLKDDIALININFGIGKTETHMMRFWNPHEVKKMLKTAGFHDIKMRPFNDGWSIQVICLN